jgi:transcriptional regulator with GAF, ATPase, and Fis domain
MDRAALNDLLDSLAALGRSMQEAFDPQRFLAGFSARVQRLIPHDRLLIAYLEDEGRTFTVFAEHAVRGPVLHEGRYTIAFDPGGRYTRDDLALGSVFEGPGSVVVDFQTDPQVGGLLRERVRKAGVRSRVAVPLYSGGRVIGAFLAASLEPATYSEEHVATATAVADLLAPLVENIVALHRERRRRRRLGALSGLAKVFGASLDVKHVFDQLGEVVRPVLDFDIMGVALIEPGGRECRLFARVGEPPAQSLPPSRPLDDFSFAERVAGGETVLIRETRQALDPSRPGDRMMLERGDRSCLAVPLTFGERVGGVLFFAKQRPYWFDADDAEVAAGVAAQVVVAIQHQRLAEEERRAAAAEGRASRLERDVETLRDALGERYGFDSLIGRAPAFREAQALAARVAPSETTVLVTGESGTGKELVARAIHQASARAAGPFVAINCAAIPDTLVESELFGHERGAFTGADRQKRGRIELAAGGTLFLDEIGELALPVQAKLLRVLQEREFQRVGGAATLKADFRLIAATNRDLARAVAERRFREDLYYRINVFTVHLPPLRERGDDVLLLATYFARTLGERMGKGEPGLSLDARDLLLSHAWPGNIRELENAVERALIVSDGGLLNAAHFALGPSRGREPAPATAEAAPTGRALAELEKEAILEALRRANGNKSHAAAKLGITRTQLYTRLKRFGINS